MQCMTQVKVILGVYIRACDFTKERYNMESRNGSLIEYCVAFVNQVPR